MYVHLQMRKSSIFYLRHDVVINNIVAWGLPAAFATIAIACGQIGYVTSHSCGPTLLSGNALLWIPLLVYISIAFLLQIWTLIEIEEVVSPPTPKTSELTRKVVRKASFNFYGHNSNEFVVGSPVLDVFENVPSQNVRFGAESEIADLCIETTCRTRTESALTHTARQRGFKFYNNNTSSCQSRSSRSTTFSLSTGFIHPSGAFSQNLKDRSRFVWNLVKLNYRMLISLTLTLFVAILVRPHL